MKIIRGPINLGTNLHRSINPLLILLILLSSVINLINLPSPEKREKKLEKKTSTITALRNNEKSASQKPLRQLECLAMTRIRTWVVSATTRSTNHYTIMAN